MPDTTGSDTTGSDTTGTDTTGTDTTGTDTTGTDTTGTDTTGGGTTGGGTTGGGTTGTGTSGAAYPKTRKSRRRGGPQPLTVFTGSHGLQADKPRAGEDAPDTGTTTADKDVTPDLRR